MGEEVEVALGAEQRGAGSCVGGGRQGAGPREPRGWVLKRWGRKGQGACLEGAGLEVSPGAKGALARERAGGGVDRLKNTGRGGWFSVQEQTCPPPNKRVQNTNKVNVGKSGSQANGKLRGEAPHSPRPPYFSNLQGKSSGFGVRTYAFADMVTYWLCDLG